MTDLPERKRGKSLLRVCYRWAIATGGDGVMHLFWHLTGQDSGKSVCGRVVFDHRRPIEDALFTPVCERCREIANHNHPLPRGMM